MVRLARVVIPGLPHHVTQRGNHGARVFARDEDYRVYLDRLQDDSARLGLTVTAYCLMPNHVHLIVVPSEDAALGQALHDTHTAYARYRNRCDATTGHVWQGRFFSCVLDEAHSWAAIRYVERNPVRAGLVTAASDYRWSSAACHCGLRADPVLTLSPDLSTAVPDWAAWLAIEDDTLLPTLRQHTSTGRPCGSPAFLAELESRLARPLTPAKPGPKPRHRG